MWNRGIPRLTLFPYQFHFIFPFHFSISYLPFSRVKGMIISLKCTWSSTEQSQKASDFVIIFVVQVEESLQCLILQRLVESMVSHLWRVFNGLFFEIPYKNGGNQGVSYSRLSPFLLSKWILMRLKHMLRIRHHIPHVHSFFALLIPDMNFW